MSIDAVCQQILSMGGKEYPYADRHNYPDVRSFYMSRFEDVPDCECNDRPPGLHVNVYPSVEFSAGHRTRPTATYFVFGEANGAWLRSEIYGVNLDEAIAFLPKAEAAGKAVWVAFVAAMKQ